jgi:hypothetical protein
MFHSEIVFWSWLSLVIGGNAWLQHLAVLLLGDFQESTLEALGLSLLIGAIGKGLE